MHDIADAFRITTHRDLPNTMVHLTLPAGDPSRIADLALQATLLSHPERKADYCHILNELARHYAQWSVGMVSIELANRVDGNRRECTSGVIAAFPRQDEVDRVIAAARESCEADNRPGCARDVRH